MILTYLALKENARVVAFTIHEPPEPAADLGARAEELVFVKDGFTWMAALFAPAWMFVNRLWLALIIYLVVAFSIGLALTMLGVAPFWVSMASIAMGVFIGLEADSIRRWTLARRGWRQVGTVIGRNRNECERRFFEDWLPLQSRPDGAQARSVWSDTVGGAPSGTETPAAAPATREAMPAAPAPGAKPSHWRIVPRPSGAGA